MVNNKKGVVLALAFILIISTSFVSAEKFGYNLLKDGKNLNPTINYTALNVTSAQYWNTSDHGALRAVADILHSWLDATSLLWSNAGHTIDTALEMESNSITNVSDIVFDVNYVPTETEPAGSVYWNDVAGTLDLVQDGTTLQLGQELFVKVRNEAGYQTINDGDVVYISGRTGQFPTVRLAQSDTETTGRILGVATEEILSPGFGKITTFGYVRHIKTDYTGTGDWGTTWVTNDLLYASKTVAGQLTNIEPDEPHHADIVGSVGIVGGVGTGSILVLNEIHVTLEELSDVDGAPLNTTGQFPVWDNDSQYFDFTYNIEDYIKNNTDGGYVYKGDFSTTPNNYDWSVHDDGANVHMEFPTLGGSNYFGIETAGSFFQLYANPNPSNDYLMATITETQGADTFLNFYEGGTGHNRFWNSGSARFGGGADYLCSNLTTDVDCDTSLTGADVVVEDDIWAGGNIFAEENITLNGSTISSWDEVNVTTDISNLVPYTGATSNVNLSDKNFTTTGEGDFGHLHIDDIHIDDEIISTSDAAALSAADAMEITITTGKGGSSEGASPTTAGDGGDLHIQTGTGGTVGVPYSAISGDGGDLTFTLGNGGQANGVAGQGGSFNVISGNGGGGGTPGAAGTITMTSGGSSSSLGNTGNGGDFAMASGTAGDANFGIGGNGGDYYISAGDGGASGFSSTGGAGGNLYFSGGQGGDPVYPGPDGNVIVDVGNLLIGRTTPFSGGNATSRLQVQGNVSINGSLFTFSPTDKNYNPLTRGNELPNPELILDANGHLSHDYLFEKETITDEWTEYPYEIEECALDEQGIEHCEMTPDRTRPVYKSQQKTDPFQIFFNNRLILSELFMVQSIVNTTNYGNLVDFDNGIMVENIFTQSKVINLYENYALKFLNASNLDSKDTHKNKETLNFDNNSTEVLNLEDRTVDLEGAFSDHMTCMYAHPKYEDYRLCMLDVNPKEKIK